MLRIAVGKFSSRLKQLNNLRRQEDLSPPVFAKTINQKFYKGGIPLKIN